MEQPILTKWLNYCDRYFTERTVEHYKMVLTRFLSTITDNKLGKSKIEAYLDDVLKDRTRATCNRHLTAIKSFCRWHAEQSGHNNPALLVKMLKEDPPKQRFLTDEEYGIILVNTKGIDRAIIQFLANTGLRRTEFKNLIKDNISDGFIRFEGKGRKIRSVPLNGVCKEIMKNYTLEGLLGRYKGREGLYWLCKKISRKTGIARFGPHALRHFFATRLIKAGVPLKKVSLILGHSSISTTERIYCHLLIEDIQDCTNCLES